MDLARRVYSRELKMAAMRELDAGRTIGETARKFQLAPKLLDRWRGEWRARGEQASPVLDNTVRDCQFWKTHVESPNWSAKSVSSPWRTTF